MSREGVGTLKFTVPMKFHDPGCKQKTKRQASSKASVLGFPV